MTTALCLACGDLKFGAYCHCPECGFEPEEQDRPLATRLSDHYLADETLRALGGIVKLLCGVSDDPRARLEALAWYLIRDLAFQDVPLALDGIARHETLLERIAPPRITPRPSAKVLLARRIRQERGSPD